MYIGWHGLWQPADVKERRVRIYLNANYRSEIHFTYQFLSLFIYPSIEVCLHSIHSKRHRSPFYYIYHPAQRYKDRSGGGGGRGKEWKFKNKPMEAETIQNWNATHPHKIHRNRVLSLICTTSILENTVTFNHPHWDWTGRRHIPLFHVSIKFRTLSNPISTSTSPPNSSLYLLELLRDAMVVHLHLHAIYLSI